MPKFDPKTHHRRSIRLKGYDYSQAGIYYVTIVTHGRKMLFGDVVDGEVVLNETGKIVQWEWQRLAQRFKFIQLGTFIVMPNHFHGIIIMNDAGATRADLIGAPSNAARVHNSLIDGNEAGATRTDLIGAPSNAVRVHNSIIDGNEGSPLPPTGPKPASLGAIIGQFKSRVTKRLWKKPELARMPIWQRDYYEHIIRNDQDLQRIWRYIESNPSMWMDDDENPANEQGRPVRV